MHNNRMNPTRLVHYGLFALIVFMIGVFWFTNLDVRIVDHYRDGDTYRGPNHAIFSFFYYPLNAILFFIPVSIGLAVVVMSLSKRPFFAGVRRHRRHGSLLVLGTLILAGVFNSIFLKALFARPRPYMVLTGDAGFYRPFEIVRTHWGAVDMSFPSGHASVAFSLLGFYFAFQHAPTLWRKVLKWGVGIVGAITLGVVMSLSRAAYGDHFLSDGLFAGVLMYGWLYLAYHLLKIPKHDRLLQEAPPRRERFSAQDLPTLIVAFAVPILLVLVLFTQFDGLRSW